MNTEFACFYFDDAVDLGLIAQKSFRYSSQVYLVPPKAVIIEFGRSHRVIAEDRFFEAASKNFAVEAGNFRVGRASHALFSYIYAKFSCQSIFDAPLIALTDLIDPLHKNEATRKKVLKLIATLSKGQIKSIRHFSEIPIRQIPTRFGKEGIQLKAKINGEFLTGFELVKPIETFSAKTELLSSYNGTLGFLINVIEQILSEKLFPPIRKLSGKIEALQITFFFETNSLHPEQSKTFSIEFAKPQYQAEDTIKFIFPYLESRFNKTVFHESTPILGVEVEVTKWLVDSDEQSDFFDEEKRRKEKEIIVQTRHKIRYGDENIFRPQLTEDRRPEFSWRKILDPNAKIEHISIAGKVPRRPIYRLENPHPIHMARDRKSLRYGARAPYEIAFVEPRTEILASHWFDNEAGTLENTYDREYFRVYLKTGHELSVYYDRRSAKWFVDGYSG